MNITENVSTQPQLIALGKLEKSPQNVRRTAAKAASAELKASILAHGLMQNLVVTETGDGTYRVIAGARRLAALKALQEDGKLPQDHAVPCQIVNDDHAAELSLAENTVRQAMHPADEFEAFAKLADAGETAGQIAERFGVSQRHVEQRLKLGRAAPALLKEYRAGNLTLECLMAFTLTDDRKRQMKVYQSLQDWQKNRHHEIRAALTERMVEADSKLAAFVGLDAYRAAGGTTRSDLFGDEVYLENPELLNALVAEKLRLIEQELAAEGWSWIVVSPERDWSVISGCSRIWPQPATAEAKADYEPEQKKLAGCYVSIAHDGSLSIELGLVRKQDKKRLTASDAEPEAEKPKGMPQTLRRELEAYRLQVAQAEIASHPAIALDLMVFTVAASAFGRPVLTGPDVDFSRHTPNVVNEQTAAAEALNTALQGLPLAWLKKKSEAEQFKAFRELAEADRLRLLAHCVAMTLQPQLSTGEEATAYEHALTLTGGSVAAYWRPAKASYLGRITRDQLLALGREILGEQWAQSRSHAKKGELADQLERAFAGPDKHGRNPRQVEKLKQWLPAGMAFGTADAAKKPAKAKKRKAA